jgi:predicted phosphodiesterase
VPLALVSDIPGNDRAFAAVVAELERLGVERGVCLGDVVQGGDEPREVLDRLARLGWPVILGNADDWLLGADSPEPFQAHHLEKRAWTLSQLEPVHLDQMRSFAPVLDIELEGGRRLRAFHGSPRSYDDALRPETLDTAAWEASGVDVLAGGHQHLQWARMVDSALYVNPGAVGVSDDGLAEFAILTGGSVAFKRVSWKAT